MQNKNVPIPFKAPLNEQDSETLTGETKNSEPKKPAVSPYKP